MQFSIRLGLIVISLCAAVFAVATAFFSPSVCVYSDLVRLDAARRLEGKTTIDDVVALLGPDVEKKSHAWVAAQIKQQNFQCPDGLVPADEFILAPEYSGPCLFHFRDNQLINIDTICLRTPIATTQGGGSKHQSAHP